MFYCLSLLYIFLRSFALSKFERLLPIKSLFNAAKPPRNDLKRLFCQPCSHATTYSPYKSLSMKKTTANFQSIIFQGKLRPSVVLLLVTAIFTIAVLLPGRKVRSVKTDNLRTKCVIYDRPMRTGSTTTTTYLLRCFRHHGFTIDSHQIGNARVRAIPHALELQSPNQMYAIARGHIWINENDVQLLRRRCDDVIYITACAPLWEQLWSAAKMLSRKRMNGNTTLSESDGKRALDWLRENAEGYIRLCEFYPFINLTKPLELQSDRRYPDLPPSFERAEISTPFTPDFVIRKHHLSEDLPKLLRAFGCDDTIQSAKNVHHVEKEDGEVSDISYEAKVRAISGVGEGETYKRLMNMAQSNDNGVRRIREIMSK